MQGRIQPVRLGGGAISVTLGVTSQYEFITVREMKYASQHCFDKAIDGKMTLYRKCCFSNCIKSW